MSDISRNAAAPNMVHSMDTLVCIFKILNFIVSNYPSQTTQGIPELDEINASINYIASNDNTKSTMR